MRPAHHSGQRRWMVLVLVVVVLAGGAVLTRSRGGAAPGGPPLDPGALVSAPDAESSAWYCTGQTTSSSPIAVGSVILTNTTIHSVTGTIDTVTDSGASTTSGVVVPKQSQLVAAVPAPASGTWESQSVILSGGGVAVTQVVHGPSGWFEAPCQSSTSQQWYFPGGDTTGTNGLFVALFNPTPTPDVVDLTFVTPGGVVHPINFQGIVLQPQQTQVENVAAFVQSQAAVATTVSTRTGRVVASELEVFSGNGSGLSLVPGSPRVERDWSIPQSLEVEGGTAGIDIFNPGTSTEDVTVQARLASGPLAPLEQRVPPNSTWVLPTSAQTRIPKGDPYATAITAKGGPGVVVGRFVAAPGGAQAPRAGLSTAVDPLSAASSSRQWVVPSLGPSAMPAIVDVVPTQLALANVTGVMEHYVVSVMTHSGRRTLASGTLAAHAFFAVGGQTLFSAGLNPLLVRASGPLAVGEDVGPTGTYGVVTLPGIPLADAIGG